MSIFTVVTAEAPMKQKIDKEETKIVVGLEERDLFPIFV